MQKKISLLFILLILSCKETKPETIQPSKSEEKKPINNSSISKDEKKKNSYFAYEKWSSINKEDEVYQKSEFIVQLKNYLDEPNNIGGKKIFINNKEIDLIITDAYVLTPFLFADGYEKILLIQEEDESGVYGYFFYYFDKKNLIKKGYLDIAPENIAEIDKFIKLKNEATSVSVNILTDKYYDTKLDEIMPSHKYHFSISKKTENKPQ